MLWFVSTQYAVTLGEKKKKVSRAAENHTTWATSQEKGQRRQISVSIFMLESILRTLFCVPMQYSGALNVDTLKCRHLSNSPMHLIGWGCHVTSTNFVDKPLT